MKNKMITSVILLIVTIVVIFNIVGNTSENLQSSAEEVAFANNCTESVDPKSDALWFNSTDLGCYNGTEGTTRNTCGSYPTYNCSKVHDAGLYNLPLNVLFRPSGVVMLILMTGILISVIVMILKKKRE